MVYERKRLRDNHSLRSLAHLETHVQQLVFLLSGPFGPLIKREEGRLAGDAEGVSQGVPQ